MFVSRERAYHGVNFGGVALSGLVNNRRKFGPALPLAHMRHTHIKENYLTQGRRRARRRTGRGPAALRQPVRRREHRRVLRRADRRVDRLPRAAEGLPQAAARDLRRARHPARVRRSDHGIRPHRPDVRRAELRRHARHHHDGESAHQRRAADGRGRDRASASTTRSWPRRRTARSSSSTATRTRAIPAACAAGLATLDIYRNEGLFERGRELSPYFQDAMFSLKDATIVADIRGYGMFAAIDVHSDGAPGRRGHVFQKKLFDNGLNLKTTGDCRDRRAAAHRRPRACRHHRRHPAPDARRHCRPQPHFDKGR